MNLRLIVLLFSSLYSLTSYGQYVLETPDGKKVMLNANGTWTFVNQNATNNKKSIPKTSTSKYASRFNRFAVLYDPNEWIVDTTKIANTYTWDANFNSTDYATKGYCMDSRLSISLENLEETIKSQWQSTGEIISLTHYSDTINNLPVIIYELQLLYNGLTYQYKGLIFSSLKGSFQLTVGTQKEVFEEDKDKIERLLRGVTKL